MGKCVKLKYNMKLISNKAPAWIRLKTHADLFSLAVEITFSTFQMKEKFCSVLLNFVREGRCGLWKNAFHAV